MHSVGTLSFKYSPAERLRKLKEKTLPALRIRVRATAAAQQKQLYVVSTMNSGDLRVPPQIC